MLFISCVVIERNLMRLKEIDKKFDKSLTRQVYPYI